MTPSTDALRLVLGVDGSDACDYALEIVQKLDLAKPQHFVLVNAVESLMPDGSFPPFRYEHPLANDQREREAAGMAKLNAALAKVVEKDIHAEELQSHGEPSGILMRIAKEENADLVVVGHNRRGALDDLMLGSVARNLLRGCPQHVLVARPPAKAEEDFVAILATDDSPESEKCVDALLRLAPKGLAKIYVLAVNEIDSGAASMLVRGLPHLQHKAEEWIAEGLQRDSEALCKRLRQGGLDAEALVVEGSDPADAICKASDATRASLIMVAARPHGFWDRIWHGSVSEAVFAHDSRSLLLLRP
ncbi:universal stress protein [bacterium]|nr:MAG: universal stress protein [bacterium]